MQDLETSEGQGTHAGLAKDSKGPDGKTGASSGRGSEQGQDSWESGDPLGLHPKDSVQGGTSCSLGKGKAVSTC